jgi:hypothetical protein
MTEQQVRDYLDEKVLNYPRYIFPEAKNRAMQHSKGGVAFWTKQTMEAARDEFHVPSGLEVVYVCPEIFQRDTLRST